MNWPKSLTDKIKRNQVLAGYTSFKIGGPAEFFLVPENSGELCDCLAFAKKNRMPVHILGSGSNILVDDCGVKGLVVKIDGKYFKELYNEGEILIAGSGLKLSRLLVFAKEKGLGAMEFLAGIPGTVGGSLAGNCGAWGRSIGDLAEQVRVLDYSGRQKLLNTKDLKFSYRSSNLREYIILQARFRLKKESKKEISENIKDYLLKRSATQQDKLPNAGCIFKNPSPAISAGKLIDSCGLKGVTRNKAMVSKFHANFILNLGNARSSDVLTLMDMMRSKVKSKFKIDLLEEIKIWR